MGQQPEEREIPRITAGGGGGGKLFSNSLVNKKNGQELGS